MNINIIKAMPAQRFITPLIFVAVLVMVFFIYRPALNGFFVFDDIPNILQNDAVAMQELSSSSLKQIVFSGTSGPLGLNRPISMVSFAINHALAGFDAYYFKLTNLGIHLINAVGLLVLTRMLLGFYRCHYQMALTDKDVAWISLAVAAAWVLHPFNLTSVLYIVQRMTSLSAFFCIWGMVLFLWGRIRVFDGKAGVLAMLGSLVMFTPMAALCKETGMLLPLFLLVIEVSFFNFYCHYAKMRGWIVALFLLSVGLPAIAALIYVIPHLSWTSSAYSFREFNLTERLMSEARIIWFYIKQIVMPSTSAMGLFHDDIQISHGLMRPITTLPAIVGIVAMPVMAIFWRKKSPILAFGILFFLAGHLLESTIFPLELAHEHRNYLPMYGLVLAMFYYMLHPMPLNSLIIRRIVSIMLVAIFAFATFSRAHEWSNAFDFAMSEVEHHPESARDNAEMGNHFANLQISDEISMENAYLSARYHFEKATSLNQNYTNGLFGLIQMSSARDKPIEQAWLNELLARLEKKPYAPDTPKFLVALTTCQMKELCKLPEGVINNLLMASLRNPTLNGRSRAYVYSAQSYYLVNIAKDYEGGLDAMSHMVDTAPDILEHRMTLIKYLFALKRYSMVKAQIAILQKLDRYGLYQTKIAYYNDELSKRN